jgi:tRNA threonylcarbamoyladenosine biosynthesis protein TsaB
MLLAIDTCGETGGVALGHVSLTQQDQVVGVRELPGRSCSELLLSTVTELVSEAGITPSQLSGVVVVNGPGSFTGIRIGVSAAKGLAEGLAIPVVALSRLELLARKSGNSNVAAALDAGRGEFYAGFYRDGLRDEEALLSLEEFSQAVTDAQFQPVACEEKVATAFADLVPELVAAPSASEALILGAKRFREGLFADVETLDANYLRRSENEMLSRIAAHAARKLADAAPVHP